jgi:hypothetical protein
MPPKQPRTLLAKLATAVRNDPQKAGILTVLVAILVVLQVRLQMSAKEAGPGTAIAGTHGAAGANNPPPLGGSGSGHGGGAVTNLSEPTKPVDAATALRSWMDAPGATLSRNLFAIELERFPADGARIRTADKDAVGFWDELAKSMTVRADVRRERQVLIENLARQASQLRLQSTMMGASPKAVIDGDLVGEGDVVASFRVLKIEPRRIIIEREGIKLEIQMK